MLCTYYLFSVISVFQFLSVSCKLYTIYTGISLLSSNSPPRTKPPGLLCNILLQIKPLGWCKSHYHSRFWKKKVRNRKIILPAMLPCLLSIIHTGRPKVNNCHLKVPANHDVLILDVIVDDLLLMKVENCIQNLYEQNTQSSYALFFTCLYTILAKFSSMWWFMSIKSNRVTPEHLSIISW